MQKQHYFLDEAGDPVFYGKGRRIIVGEQGVSSHFILGMVSFGEEVDIVRQQVLDLQKEIESGVYFQGITSIQRKRDGCGYFFHATDDIPEVRKLFYDFIKSIDCTFEAVIVKKVPEQFIHAHSSNSNEFYADVLSHLLHNKLNSCHKVVLNIAKRGTSTRHDNLGRSLKKAISRHQQLFPGVTPTTDIAFNVQNQVTEPLLNVADYLCWCIQRAFEKGEYRFFEYMKDKIKLQTGIDDDWQERNDAKGHKKSPLST